MPPISYSLALPAELFHPGCHWSPTILGFLPGVELQVLSREYGSPFRIQPGLSGRLMPNS